jgi:hypothetical protein
MASPLVEHSKSGFRTWFRKVWKVRGGGLYAVGFAATFLYLEIVSLADDVLGIGALFRGEAVEFFVNFIIDSFTNTIAAFMWPVDVIQFAPPAGAIALGIAFWLFPIYVKPHVERWLFDDESGQAVEQGEDNEVA